MDLDRTDLYVPSFAVVDIKSGSGLQMTQALPNDYTLASITLRAMELKNGEDMEFLLKVYSPVRLFQNTSLDDLFAFDMLGSVSSKYSRISSSKIFEPPPDSSELLDHGRSLRAFLVNEINSPSTNVVGLISNPLNQSIQELLKWPTLSTLESYAVIIDGILDNEIIESEAKSLVSTSDRLSNYESKIPGIADSYFELVERRISYLEESQSGKISRLEQRIEKIGIDLEEIESRLKTSKSSDLLKIRDARRSALQRDIARKDALKLDIETESAELLEIAHEIKSLAASLLNKLDTISSQIERLRLDSIGRITNDKDLTLLIPFILAGYSKKGRLRVEAFPPSMMLDLTEKVGIRRDFVDSLKDALPYVEPITKSITNLANNDVTFRRFLREQSKKRNLLSETSARALILAGLDLLVADAIVKESMASELKDFVNQIPAVRIERKTKTIPITATADEISNVTFIVTDQTGHAISNVRLDLGLIELVTDNRGRASIQLPRSNYDAKLEAAGYQEEGIEFSLTRSGDLVVPVILQALSHEEKLSHSLDELVGRAKRIDQIKSRLQEAFDMHGETIINIPAYRTVLSQLLKELGYDPESWIADATTKKGMMKRLLKRDERKDGIRRDLLWIAEHSKDTGGMMLISEILVRLDEKGWATNPNEIEALLNEMIAEGLIEGISGLENGARVVTFIPVELTDDPRRILSLASKNDGKLTLEDAMVSYEWSEERAKKALDLLVENGVAKIQKRYSRSTAYWFPGLRSRKK